MCRAGSALSALVDHSFQPYKKPITTGMPAPAQELQKKVDNSDASAQPQTQQCKFFIQTQGKWNVATAIK